MDSLLEQFRKKPKVVEQEKYKIKVPITITSQVKDNSKYKENGEENVEEEMEEVKIELKGDDGFKIIDNTKILKKEENEKYNNLREK